MPHLFVMKRARIKISKYSRLAKLFIQFLLLLSIQSCHKNGGACPPIKDEFLDMIRSDLKALKYDEFDTLKFISSKTGPVTYIGTGTLDSSVTIYWANTGNDCRYWRMNAKSYTLTYKNSKNEQLLSGAFYSGEVKCFGYLINNTNYYSLNDLRHYPHPIYEDSVVVNGKVFNKVIKIYKDNSEDYKYYLYYGLDDGIIKVILPTKDTLIKVD